MCSIDSGLWCWDATPQAASDDTPSQCRGWRGVLSFSLEVGMRQGRVTLPCKSLRRVRAPNTFGDRERYTQLFPPSYAAAEIRRGAYDLASFTPSHLHTDYTSSPWYAQAASGSGSGGKTKKASKPPSPQQVASAVESSRVRETTLVVLWRR